VSYAVKAIFDTIQGEGARAGARSVFVRFAGCNLWSGRPEDRARGQGACARWCDTDFVRGEKLSAGDILTVMHKLWSPMHGERWCVLTGGEPALQVDAALLEGLHRDGWKVAMETNGTVELGGLDVDWLTVSPKKGGEVVLRGGTELKVVLPGAIAGEPGWTDDELVELDKSRLWQYRFVQPMDPPLSAGVEDTHLHPARAGAVSVLTNTAWSNYECHKERCVRFVKQHPGWRIGMQLHKAWHLP
jgi:organic radical activating enzyme